MANASAKGMNSMHRLRYLIDVIVIALVFFGFDAAADALPLPNNFRIVIVVSTLAKCLCLVFIWWYLRLRGDNLATIGLKKPRSWPMSILGGVMIAAVLFIGVYLLERAGFRRDMSAFALFKGNLEFTLYQLAGIIIAAGLVKSFCSAVFSFSGWLCCSAARMWDGASRVLFKQYSSDVFIPTRTPSVCCLLARSAWSWESSSSLAIVTSGCRSLPTRFMIPLV
jgi:hypothetical protein